MGWSGSVRSTTAVRTEEDFEAGDLEAGDGEFDPDRIVIQRASEVSNALAIEARVKRSLGSARDLLRRREAIHRETPFPFAVEALDAQLQGGVERGTFLEIHGEGTRSCGRSALVLSLLARSTDTVDAAFIDLGDGLDVEAAILVGCDLRRLLWIRPQRLKDAVAAAEIAISGGFPLVVLDLGAPPIAGISRLGDGAWMRLQRAAEAQRAAFVLSAPYRVSGPAATTVLRAAAARSLWSGRGDEPRLLAALDARLAIEKARRGENAPETHREIAMPFVAREVGVWEPAFERRERLRENGSTAGGLRNSAFGLKQSSPVLVRPASAKAPAGAPPLSSLDLLSLSFSPPDLLSYSFDSPPPPSA